VRTVNVSDERNDCQISFRVGLFRGKNALVLKENSYLVFRSNVVAANISRSRYPLNVFLAAVRLFPTQIDDSDGIFLTRRHIDVLEFVQARLQVGRGGDKTLDYFGVEDVFLPD
jgi:hypothetical protein